jgi:hypothetical protein
VIGSRIGALPDWKWLDHDQLEPPGLYAALDDINTHSTSDIRAAYELLLAHDTDGRFESRLLIVSHYIFDLTVFESPPVSGWVIPWRWKNGPTWPFAREAGSRRLRLADTYHGYSGASYDPLREFDYLAVSCPRTPMREK